MSPEPLDLHLDHEDRGLRYRCNDVVLVIARERTRWRVQVMRDNVILGVSVANLADARGRRDLLRSLRGLEDGEDLLLDRLLIAVAGRVDDDWTDHERLQEARDAAASSAADHEQGRRTEEARTERLADLEPAVLPRLADPALLFRVGEAIAAQGLVGERVNGLLLYLALLSRLLETPISIVVKGDSSGGKSHLVKTVLRLVPQEAHLDFTSMSERALIYDQRPYAHRTIVIYEVHGQGNEFVNYLIRTLISEGEIRHVTVETEGGEARGVEIVKEGPTNFITTTTAPEGHAENETRIWTLLVDDSPATTRAVLQQTARRAAGTFQAPDPRDWRGVQEWLELAGEHRVVVPFAETLAAHLPDRPLRLRRDFERLLLLVQSSALLHQRQRGRGSDGAIVADLADYAIARTLAADAFHRIIAELTEKTIDLVDALAAVLDEKRTQGVQEPVRASYTDLVRATGRPKYYLSRWLQPAIQLGVVDNTESQKGKPAALKLGSYVLSHEEALPALEVLASDIGTAIEWVDPLSGERCLVDPAGTATLTATVPVGAGEAIGNSGQQAEPGVRSEDCCSVAGEVGEKFSHVAEVADRAFNPALPVENEPEQTKLWQFEVE